jgi:hypothetical protein
MIAMEDGMNRTASSNPDKNKRPRRGPGGWRAIGIAIAVAVAVARCAAQTAPVITSLSPNGGPVGTAVTINGTGFGSTQSTSTITFNGTIAAARGRNATSWSNTAIVVAVPAGATSGSVIVKVGTQSSNPVQFTVGTAITSLSATSGVPGTTIVVNGLGFGTTQGASTVTFNGTPGTPTSWSDSSIAVPVPAGATTGNVVVTSGGSASNGVLFTVTASLTITGFSPATGPAGAQVTITGTGFGASQGTSNVQFNGANAASIASWSNTQIIAVVPSTATSGPVTVLVSGATATGGSFTFIAPPVITGLSLSTGPETMGFAIQGRNFGVYGGGSLATLNFQPMVVTSVASVTQWTDTEIKVTVPVGASTGPVVVHAPGGIAQGPSFTVVDPFPCPI